MRITDTTMDYFITQPKVWFSRESFPIRIAVFRKEYIYRERVQSKRLVPINKVFLILQITTHFGKFKSLPTWTELPTAVGVWGSARVHHHKSDYQLGTPATNLIQR